MCLSLVRQVFGKLFCFDVYVSYQYLLFVVYSVMSGCLYAELKLASCTWAVRRTYDYIVYIDVI